MNTNDLEGAGLQGRCPILEEQQHYAIRLHEILQGFGTLFLTGGKKKKELADSSVKRAAFKVSAGTEG